MTVVRLGYAFVFEGREKIERWTRILDIGYEEKVRVKLFAYYIYYTIIKHA